MSKDLIQALEDIIDPIGAMQRDLQDGYQLDGHAAIRQINSREFYVNLAKQALSRHRSSVESVDLPEAEWVAKVDEGQAMSGVWWTGDPPPAGEVQLYTATTVRSLIAAAVEPYRSALAACRNACPIPEPGSPLEVEWGAVMGDPLAVEDWFKAAIKAAVERERELCAKVCDAQIERWTVDLARYCTSECAAAIRSRGEMK